MIVAIKMEKVQKYIYQRVDDLRSNQQQDEKTLQHIMDASRETEEILQKRVKDRFEVEKYILNTSGKIIFRTNGSEEDLRKRGKELFREVYLAYAGKIWLNYICVEEKKDSFIDIIRRADQQWKNVTEKNRIIEENADLLFDFPLSVDINKSAETIKQAIQEEPTCAFAQSMDDLRSSDKEKIGGSQRDKMAIVKADINKMGEIFRQVSDYPTYQKISRVLSEKVSISYLETMVRENYFADLQGNLLPFYMAGDDIFYGVKIEQLFRSLMLIRELIKRINADIAGKSFPEIIKNPSSEAVLTVSVGVSFVENFQPIRYYREEVEKELSLAKREMKHKNKDEDKKTTQWPHVLMAVSMAGVLMYQYIGMDGKGATDGYNKFQTEISQLKHLKQQKCFTNSFIHNLVEILEYEEDQALQMRLFLYYALPRVTESKGKDHIIECQFKKYLLDHLFEKKGKSRGLQPANINKRLIPKLKLLMLLLKEEYMSEKEVILSKEGKTSYIFSEKIEESLKSRVFLKPLEYIYLENSDAESDASRMFSLFVRKMGKRKEHLIKQGEKTKIDKADTWRNMGYQIADFHPSFFYRVKNLVEADKIDQAIKMFENYSGNYLKGEQERKLLLEKEGLQQSIYKQRFDITKFKKIAKNLQKKEWLGLLDDLIIFYRYSAEKKEYISRKKGS